MKLNVGCGGLPGPKPWINVDRSTGTRSFPCHPDVVADLRTLPFKDDAADAVYAGHVLEHIEYDEVCDALAELRRVLRPGGELAVVGPDMDRAVGEFAEFAPIIWPGLDGDWSSWPGAGHQYCPTATNTLDRIVQVFPDAHEVPVAGLDESWPIVDRAGWQFAFLATKEAP